MTTEKLLRALWNIASADARELTEYTRGACRHCYGFDHKYQRTVAEYDSDLEQWEKWGGRAAEVKAKLKRKGQEVTDTPPNDIGVDHDAFDAKGGTGFDPTLTPHAKCPACHGKGTGRAHINDTRLYGPEAVALYAGIKVTKEGIEVKTNDKGAAFEKIAKHIGFYAKDNEQSADAIAMLLELNRNLPSTLDIVANPEDDGQ